MSWRKKKKEGYPLVLYTVNPSTSPGAFQRCSVKTWLFPCPSSWSSGGGAAVLSLRCVHLGELPCPRQVSGSVEVVDPRGPCPLAAPLSQAGGDTRRGNPTGRGQLPSPGVSSRSNHPSSQSALAWMLPCWGRGAGAAGLHSSGGTTGQVCSGSPGPSPPPPVGAEHRIWVCVCPSPSDPGSALLESGS